MLGRDCPIFVYIEVYMNGAIIARMHYAVSLVVNMIDELNHARLYLTIAVHN